MWSKLNIFTYKNTDKNYYDYFLNDKSSIISSSTGEEIKLPFNVNSNKLYIFELFKCNKLIKLNIIVNTFLLGKTIKSQYFDLLKYNLYKAINNKNYIQENFFNLYKNIDTTYISIDNSYDNYNVAGEKIIPPNFCYLYGNVKYINSCDKVCVIDNINNFNQIESINNSNYLNFSYQSLHDRKIILLDKDFFLSNTYMEIYNNNKISNVKEFTNIKYRIINSLNQDSNFINVELLDKVVFIFKNLDVLKLFSHPIFFSNNKIIFNFNNISHSSLLTAFNHYNYQTNNKFFFNHVFLDVDKYHVYKKYLKRTVIPINISNSDLKNEIHSPEVSKIDINILGDRFIHSLLKKPNSNILLFDKFSKIVKIISKVDIVDTYKVHPELEIDYQNVINIYVLGDINIYYLMNIKIQNDFNFIKLSPNI